MIKQIFTWWNSQTLGTFLYTIFFGKFVGEDEFGNKYYQNKKDNRWVVYNGEINASKITSDWFSWMHHTTDKIPSNKKLQVGSVSFTNQALLLLGNKQHYSF